MVLDVASYIKSMVKTDTICIDNFVFRLHYRVTVAILLAASIIGRLTQNRFLSLSEGQRRTILFGCLVSNRVSKKTFNGDDSPSVIVSCILLKTKTMCNMGSF